MNPLILPAKVPASRNLPHPAGQFHRQILLLSDNLPLFSAAAAGIRITKQAANNSRHNVFRMNACSPFFKMHSVYTHATKEAVEMLKTAWVYLMILTNLPEQVNGYRKGRRSPCSIQRQLSLTELTATVSSKICVLSLMTALCTPRFMAASFCQRWLWMKKPILCHRFRKLPQTVAGQDLCISLLTIIGYHGFTKGAGCFGFFSLNMQKRGA